MLLPVDQLDGVAGYKNRPMLRACVLLLTVALAAAFDSSELRMLEDEFLHRKHSKGLLNYGADAVEKRSAASSQSLPRDSFDESGSPLMGFGKRDPGAPLIRFGRAPEAQPLIRFGKRTPEGAPLIRFGRDAEASPLIRFGKRSAPLIRFGRSAAPLVRFGRSPEAAPLLRFGRSPEASPLIRFGKK
ncbi:hypothetical protein Q1695_005787 [Nippostrongylus brasiliensis]|nr:hypothetical protein Q1695_005787 [Nippostrongylus brasiliensis]